MGLVRFMRGRRSSGGWGNTLLHNSSCKTREAERRSFFVAARQRAGWTVILYLAVGIAGASAQAGSTPTAESIIARMALVRAKNRARLRPYVVTRNYKLFGKDESKAKSEVVADIDFVPPDSKKFTIQETSGSGLGPILVRRMLISEAEVTRDRNSTDLSPDNYEFRFLRAVDEGGQRCYVLQLLPRRKERHLLRGDIWVDANTYLLRRFEGQLAKPPSWWVRDVSVTLAYSEVGGMWLQTATEAAADVRILGRTTMISRDVKYRIPEPGATAVSVQTGFLESMPGAPFRLAAVASLPK